MISRTVSKGKKADVFTKKYSFLLLGCFWYLDPRFSATSAKITPDQEDETVRRRKIVDALHAFNDVKDSALAIFHALAELRQTSMAALFSEFQVDREGDD